MSYLEYSSDAMARSPGVGEAGSTDATDLANLRVSAAMRAADQANANGSNIIPMPPQNGGNLFATNEAAPDSAPAIAEQRNQRLLALTSAVNNNTDPDNPALYVTPRRRQELLLERRDLTQEVHDSTMDEARLAHEHFVMQRDVNAGQQFKGLADRLSQITSDPTMPAGSPERGAALIKAAQDFPDGFASKAGKELTRGITEGHDQQAMLEDRAYQQRYGQAHNEAAQVGKKFGVDVQYDDQGWPSVESTTKYGQENGTLPNEDGKDIPPSIVKSYSKLQGDIATHAADAATEAQTHSNAKRENVPYSKSAEWAAKEKEAQILEKHFPGLKDAAAAAAATPSPAPGAPEPGTVKGKFKFKGGNPADKNNWEPVNG